jgi:ribosomal protein L37AE/L43A
MIDDMILDGLCDNLIRRREMICRLRMRASRSLKRSPGSETTPKYFFGTTNRPGVVEQIASRGRRQIRQIDHALIKMAQEQYGTCEECHRPIAIKRLKTVPWTRHCIRCVNTPAGSFLGAETSQGTGDW